MFFFDEDREEDLHHQQQQQQQTAVMNVAAQHHHQQQQPQFSAAAPIFHPQMLGGGGGAATSAATAAAVGSQIPNAQFVSLEEIQQRKPSQNLAEFASFTATTTTNNNTTTSSSPLVDITTPTMRCDTGYHHHYHQHYPQQQAAHNFSSQKAKKWHFNDYYKLVDDHLGSGAYASVKTAINLATGEEFAVKLVSKHEHGHTRSRIMREVQIFKLCRNHPNIVQLIEWFEDDSCFYMVFEKMRGGPLLNHIQRKVCFTEQEASLVTRDIANALKFLHDRGIAHRDVKPENILCTELDKISPVKLCDLDLASKPFDAAAATSNWNNNNAIRPVQSEPDLASPVGSAEFMAPEVVDAFVGEALKYDKRCDMWSLGVIIYIMLCGYPPFYGECERENCGWDQGESCSDCQENLFHRIQGGYFDFPDEEWKHISASAKDLIRHLLVRNVRQRYTADEVLAHPWVTRGAPKTPLQTATNLSRNDSARDVHQMNENFLLMNRIVPIIARLSSQFNAAAAGEAAGGAVVVSGDGVGGPPLPLPPPHHLHHHHQQCHQQQQHFNNHPPSHFAHPNAPTSPPPSNNNNNNIIHHHLYPFQHHPPLMVIASSGGGGGGGVLPAGMMMTPTAMGGNVINFNI